MKLTNSTGIPKPVFEELEKFYNSHPKMATNTFSATEVLKPAKQILLGRVIDKDKLPDKDVQYVMKTIRGTWVHYAMELLIGKREDCRIEQAFEMPFPIETSIGTFEVTLSGRPDLLWEDEDGDLHLVDWKNSNSYRAKKNKEGEETEWKDQAYIYSMLIEHNLGKRPVDATYLSFDDSLKAGDVNLEDWDTLPCKIITFDTTDREYEKGLVGGVNDRLTKVIECREMGFSPEDCTEEDRWQSAPQFKIHKVGKSCVKTCYTMEDAEGYIIQKGWQGKGYVIDSIPSCPKKCLQFCDYLSVCPQGQKLVEEWNALGDGSSIA